MLKMPEFVIQDKFLLNNKYKLFNMYIAYCIMLKYRNNSLFKSIF